MKWFYFIKQKFKTALALAVVFALVLCTNLLDKMHFDELHETINSVHKDRLLVENYIYNISQSLNNKRIALYEFSFRAESVDDTSFNKSNKNILSNINEFQKTVLTHEEDTILNNLAKEVIVLEIMENKFLLTENISDSVTLPIVLQQHDILNTKLSRLSEIQLEEGEKLLEESNSIISISTMSSRLEIAVLIVVGLIIQIIVISSKSPRPKFPQESNLN